MGDQSAIGSAVVVQVDEEVTELVERVWEGVMRVAEEVVRRHDELGFDLISKKVNPSLADIAHSLAVVGKLLDVVGSDSFEMSLTRQILNAKQQIYQVTMAASALRENNPTDYHKAIDALRSQAPF